MVKKMSREDWERIRAEAQRLRTEIENFVEREQAFLSAPAVGAGLNASRQLFLLALRGERLAHKNPNASAEGWPLA